VVVGFCDAQGVATIVGGNPYVGSFDNCSLVGSLAPTIAQGACLAGRKYGTQDSDT